MEIGISTGLSHVPEMFICSYMHFPSGPSNCGAVGKEMRLPGRLGAHPREGPQAAGAHPQGEAAARAQAAGRIRG